MIATNKQRSYRYDGKRILPGEIFDVRDEHVVLLIALGWVKDMAAVKAMTAENTPALVPTPTRYETGVGARLPQTVNVQSFVEENLKDENTSETETLESNNFQTDEASETLLTTDSTESLTQTVNDEEGDVVIQSQEYSKMLRERATALGIKVDGRWSDTRVQREIDEYNAKTYKHMDMRAFE